MGFSYEPCPWCGSTSIKMMKGSKGTYVQCSGCKMRLEMFGRSMLDCARMWNVRASRRSEMGKRNMEEVSLLHADIAMTNPNSNAPVYLENTEAMWELALAAEQAYDMDATHIRPDGSHFEVRYHVLFPYLDALVQESAEKVTAPELPPSLETEMPF